MLTSIEALKIIREFAAKDAIKWSKHSKQWMQERKISTLDVLECLLKGKVAEEPCLSNKKDGGFETAIEKKTAKKLLRVVVEIQLEKNLIIITVY